MHFMLCAAFVLTSCGVPEPQTDRPESKLAATKLWVTTQYADRHTCPSAKCGVVGRMFFSEGTKVHETRDGWARVSSVYDASCEGGRSRYVDKGTADCTGENGIVNGRFAEWVRSDQLSSSRPADPAASAASDESLVADSDDFREHRRAFTKAAAELIAKGQCSAADFKEIGGWAKSSNHRDTPVYFTYCGGMTLENRIYLDAASGRIFQLPG